jgi:catechol 2,3-dioxygenase
MTTDTQLSTETTFTLHPATRLGHVHYTAADLERQIAFYQDILGFKLHWREGASAGLGAGGEDLLRLTELPGARRVRRTTGLYHTAFLVPTRWDLAQLLRSIAETRTPIQGMVNHHTHLAIYLPDAEGNGIELAWDFPKEQWPKMEDMLRLGNGPLEPQELFAELERDPSPWTGLNPATQVGHVHLHVADLQSSKRFYHDVLGFDITMDIEAFGGIFFAAGGYHHHIGTNVWQGVGAPPPPPDAIGLRYFTVVLPDKTEPQRVVERVRQAGIPTEATENGVLVRDPAGNGVLLTPLDDLH